MSPVTDGASLDAWSQTFNNLSLAVTNQSLAAISSANSGSLVDGVTMDVLKYGKYYNAYFASGMAAMVVLVGLMVYVGLKKY